MALLDGPPTAGDDADDLARLVRAWSAARYARSGIADRFHGMTHADEVERNALAALSRVPFTFTASEQLAVRCAALVHDVGYTEYQADWSRDRREHVVASVACAMRALGDVAGLAAASAFTTVVAFLVAHHDDTNYKHPSRAWSGRAQPLHLGAFAPILEHFAVRLSGDDRARLRAMLGALREADGLAGAGMAGAERTLGYSLTRGLPMFGAGDPLAAWCWEESAVGNIRLAGKRALIDAITPDGRAAALAHYREAEQFIARICLDHGIEYQPETRVPGLSFGQALERREFRVIRYASWAAARRFARKPGTNRAASRSLTACHVSARPRRHDLRGLAATVLATSGSSALGELEALLAGEYALSIFDLAGVLDYWLDGVRYRLGPVIVATGESGAVDAESAIVLDGRKRVLLAHDLGVRAMWTAEVHDEHIGPHRELA